MQIDVITAEGAWVRPNKVNIAPWSLRRTSVLRKFWFWGLVYVGAVVALGTLRILFG